MSLIESVSPGFNLKVSKKLKEYIPTPNIAQGTAFLFNICIRIAVQTFIILVTSGLKNSSKQRNGFQNRSLPGSN